MKAIFEKERRENLGGDFNLELVTVPGGKFMMGAAEGEEYSTRYEKPRHPVILSTFKMGRYPITQAQWREVASWEQVERELNRDPSYFKDDYMGIDRWTRPVEQVSWEEAKEFCARLSKRTKKLYRLPIEAEWEYACRAGTTKPFHFDDKFVHPELLNCFGHCYYQSVLNEYKRLSFDKNDTRVFSREKEKYRKQTTPVGNFLANAYGLYDMHGQVWEWCEDIFYDYKIKVFGLIPWRNLPSNLKPSRVIRGGSWRDGLGKCRSTSRDWERQDDFNNKIGFRVVEVVPWTA